MISYWAYLNHSAKTATVHNGWCRHCNHGFGPKRQGDTYSGRWQGPHSMWGAAFSTARDTTDWLYEVKWCARCKPEDPWGPSGHVGRRM